MNRDYRDLFAAFNAQKVDYLIVGAYALAVHGHVRATKDLDVWVRPTHENAIRVLAALELFGAPTEMITVGEFERPGMILQLGYSPVRIDVTTTIDGVNFDQAWSSRISADYGDQSVFVISRADLIANKKATGRLQDLADVDALENGVSE